MCEAVPPSSRAAALVPRPLLCLSMVMQGQDLHGLYIGSPTEAWNQASDLSAQLNIISVDRPFQRVLSAPAEMYNDLWTAAKAMYKTEPAIADGGEVIIYAPHITGVSYTHGKLIDEVGYHVRDYFLKQWDRFPHVPGSILAHSTRVKGTGTYDAASGIETPRISVTLATGIPEERCRRINLGYADYREIDPKHGWAANRRAFSASHTPVRCSTALVTYRERLANPCRLARTIDGGELGQSAPSASPRNTVIGHTIGVLAGYFSLVVTGLTASGPALAVGVTWPRVIAAALSLGLTAGLMVLSRSPHPPAGAT
jgi:hypothetical protein